MAENVRLDKFISDSSLMTRKEATSAIKSGLVTVNGKTIKSGNIKINTSADTVCLSGCKIAYSEFIYVMLNKPEGYVSATEDGKDKTVLELLPPELARKGLFPAGRLDKNTLGLMLLTNDGDTAHRLLSPKHHVQKKYKFKSKFPLSEDGRVNLERGATLEDGYVTKPSVIELDSDGCGGYITLTEGKYHQIKRMFESVGNKIIYLERISFGALTLDASLECGQWRYLTEKEISDITTS